jgi:hypothetical protein
MTATILKRNEQAFFNQNGLVTDAMPEVNVFRRATTNAEEAKARNQEDRIKNVHWTEMRFPIGLGALGWIGFPLFLP